jgi:ACS family hexuronate transporter-like MFS transporter
MRSRVSSPWLPSFPSIPSLRWWAPTATMMLLSFISYVDRNTLALLSHTILRDTGLTAEQYGFVISAFSIAYLVGNPLWGRALDRYGLRIATGCAVTLWTAASVAHAFVRSAAGFAAARAALGFCEGATFPAGFRTASQTLREAERARGVALAYSGGSLGAIVTPLLVTPIALRWGWRGAFVATGVLGITWVALWAGVGRDERVRNVRNPPDRATGDAAAPLSLRSRPLWAFMAVYALGAVPLGLVLYIAPIDLGRRLGCDQATLGRLLWIPPLGWEVGYFFWGWIVDRAAQRAPLARAWFHRTYAALAVLSLPFAATAWFRSRAAVLALLFLGTFTAAGYVIASLAEVTRKHAPDHAATLAGLGAGSWSAVIAVVMPLFGRLLDAGAYGTTYVIGAAAPFVALVAWHVLQPGDPTAKW